MNGRLPTIFDDLFPDSSPEFAAICDAWPDAVIIEMLTLVWDAFDQLKALPNFRQLDFAQDYAQLKRSLTDLHAQEVTLLYKRRTGYESFMPHHEPWEFETLSDRSARPPSADIGFVLRANRRLRWAVETKVLENPDDIARYLEDLGKYLTGKSSPLSTQAALGAYLIQGQPDSVFLCLASALGTPLAVHPAFPFRPHRTSEHRRDKSKLPAVTPTEFVCHHLVFSLA